MVRRGENFLQGMKEIAAYVNRSHATVLRWIREMAFPAAKLDGSTWEADRELVDQWRKSQLEAIVGKPQAPAPGGRRKGSGGGERGRPRKGVRKAA